MVIVSAVVLRLLEYFRTALAGILPFGAMFIELFFILSVSFCFHIYVYGAENRLQSL